jgi:hypothetical protein
MAFLARRLFGSLSWHLFEDVTLPSSQRQHVEAGAASYTDALPSYEELARDYAHKVFDHAVQYADGPRIR